MEKIRIQDDLYNYVNGEWIENATIPDDKPSSGGFADLRDEVEKILMADFREMSNGSDIKDVNLRRACALYSAVLDTKRRSKEGINPVRGKLNKIKKLSGMGQFNRNLKDLILDGYPLPFDIIVFEDMKDSSKNCLAISGPSTILPDTTYYKDEMKPQRDALLGVWTDMTAKVLKYARLTDEERSTFLADTLKFDAIIAGLVKSAEEWSDYTKVYNPMKIRTVGSLLAPVKFRKAVTDIFGTVPDNVIVMDVRFLKGFKTLFNEENFELYKHWAYVRTLLEATSLLSEKLRDIGMTYRRTLMGLPSIPSVEKYAYQLAGNFYSQPIGLYYGVKYFGEEAKKDVISMVKEIIETWKVRVCRSDILSDATKEKAILKLSTMKIKMGYPDKIDDVYDRLVFCESDSLYTIVDTLEKATRIYWFEQLYKPVDKSKWVMPGHMVNACYNPASNDITFPAAILQAPFYSIKQTRSRNLGGIGAVISHEISHAFDNNGAKMDENGNLNDWWTKEDKKRFEKSIKAMVKQYEGITLPWGNVNAKLIVSENVADNGGVACTLDIMRNMEDADYEEYFMNFARIWRMKAREEYLKLLLSTDVHGPAILRANMTVRNFSEWYDTFNVTNKDKMYLAPSKRVVIW